MSIPEWISAFSDTISALVTILTFLGLESPVRRRASDAAPPTNGNELEELVELRLEVARLEGENAQLRAQAFDLRRDMVQEVFEGVSDASFLALQPSVFKREFDVPM
ncbi:hypothetical protein TrVFT333_001071 [Trichoderma virens FT-333]|nr:hypothetical protein TrVFT333_001071 [Trichoderma virens FT-333]